MKQAKRTAEYKSQRIDALEEKFNEATDGSLNKRNKSLYKLVYLRKFFHDIKWKLRDSKRYKEKYPLEIITLILNCSKRVAYDYQVALTALDISYELFFSIDDLHDYLKKLKKAGVEI